RLGIILFSFTIITEAVVYTSAIIFQRELWYKYFMLASLSGSLVSIAAVFVVTQFSQGLFAIYVCFILVSVVRSGLDLFFTRQRVFPINIDMQFAKRLTLDTLPIAFMLICNLIYFRVDILLLSFLKSSQDVGIYDLAYKFFDFLIALPLFLSNTLYPSL